MEDDVGMEDENVSNSLDDAKRKIDVSKVVSFIPMILEPVQLLLNTVGVDVMKKMLEEMEDDTSQISAWPFPRTIVQAKRMRLKNDMFRKIIELVEAQKELFEYEDEMRKEKGNEHELMQMLGVDDEEGE